ncbi:hypothetical protein MSIM_00050 [Mycobacterium simiae]|nr:hypothetical protein MSIM_00050 [Mycobacterium simiae]
MPIGWAEHVLAEGLWGRAMREYMRDYNHWATVGVLNELLPQPDNRVTLADERDPYGLPVARFDYTLCDNDKANMKYSTKVIADILHAADAQDILTIQRFAHLIGGARMGTNQRIRWSTPTTAWAYRTCSSPTGRSVPGVRPTRIDHHGAGIPAGRANGGWEDRYNPAACSSNAQRCLMTPIPASDREGQFRWHTTS